MTFYERRERIKQILKCEGRVSCGELAKRLGVTKNTIANDINAITMTFPIATYFGRNGGYEYRGDGTTILSARQTRYLYAFMRRYEAEASDEMFAEILAMLEHASPKDE